MSIAVVIGASAAGIAAAHSLSRRFRQVLLIERRPGLNLRQRFRTTANVHVWEDAEAVYLLPSAAGVGGVAIRQHRGARTQCVPAGLVVDATGNNAALE